MSLLGRYNKILFENLEKLEVVNIGGYIMSWNYAHILKDLLGKHGDISHISKLTVEEKSINYFLLCGVIGSMCRTSIVDVTKDLLEDWYASMNAVDSDGFEIDFVYARLEQVVRAYYGLQVSRSKTNMATQMDRNIADLEHRVAQLRQQIENLKGDLESSKAHCEELRKQWSSENFSDFMKECLCKASLLKWEAAGKNLL